MTDETAEGRARVEARDVIAFGLDNWVGEELTKTADAILSALEAEGYTVARLEPVHVHGAATDRHGFYIASDEILYRRTDQEPQKGSQCTAVPPKGNARCVLNASHDGSHRVQLFGGQWMEWADQEAEQ